MKSGFTVLELIIALLLASIISVTLYNSFFVITRVIGIADDLIEVDAQIAIVANQLEKDLSGVFVPLQIKKKDEKKAPVKTKTEKSPEKIPEKKKERKVKPIEKIFYSAHKGKNLSVLTFLTSNPVRVYEDSKNGKVKPRIVRIVYSLVPDGDNSFKLMRQESTNLDYKAFESKSKPIRGFELAPFVKSLDISYTYPVVKEETKKSEKKSQLKVEKKEEKKVTIEYKTSTEWKFDKKSEEQGQPIIPQFITITLTLWDNLKDQSKPFTFNYEVASFSGYQEEQKKEKKEQESKKKEAKKPNEKKETEKSPPTPVKPTTNNAVKPASLPFLVSPNQNQKPLSTKQREQKPLQKRTLPQWPLTMLKGK